ncbi:VWA domain-containing protein [Ottowia sp. GY511]|uniref:von Willebrand factor type A domain-containing protein n=1 Tax=Ottowia flava TaxID=2675430 RepID=A0ABW4KRD3_9BURK|nr:VWA domain-containing protein [Ottowia sp. GY511]TXK32831.1 VWA domain-containing protein [Ottowia sp. GY511]
MTLRPTNLPFDTLVAPIQRRRGATPVLTVVVVAALLAACSTPVRQSSSKPQADAAASASAAVAAPSPAAAPVPAPPPAYQAQPAPRAGLARNRAVATGNVLIAPPMPLPQQALPGRDTERYDKIKDNPVKLTAQDAVSTLSLDVDTGSYSNMRRFLKQGRLPPADAVRVEELLNYFPFPFTYSNQPTAGAPFGVTTEVAPAPWNAQHLLLRVGVKAVDVQSGQMPPANLVFMVDTSGSMARADKMPLVQATLRMLTEQLRPQDSVSIVTYSGHVSLALPATNDKQKILGVVGGLRASGATSGGQALAMAYEQARAAFKPGGINRIVMATDGDFNVGVANVEQLKSMVARERASGVSLTTLGFGTGNLNEPMMKQLALVGNGNYSYIDSATEARKVLVQELSSTFNTVAADVKLQLEFNPASVAEWRLIGYENRVMSEADFRNDQVDAVEIGAGKSVTALYELTPVGQTTLHAPRRYGQTTQAAATGKAGELAEWRVRYKAPGQSQAREIRQPIAVAPGNAAPSVDFKFAAAVAGFGQLLRTSPYIGQWTYDDALALARAGRGDDPQGYRAEFVQLVETARTLAPKAPGAGMPGNLQAPQ